MEKLNILVINPGSTSTKISYYEKGLEILNEEFHHDTEFLQGLSDDEEFRYRLDLIKNISIPWENLHGIVGRGGLLKPLKSGTYIINDKMIRDLKSNFYGKHASNLGAILAFEISKELNIPSFIVDPVVVDEMNEIAKFSGIPELKRRSIFHALNQKGVSKMYCRENEISYDNVTFIVVHMGGGISVGIHKNGDVIDVNNALDGDGPFTPERAGTLPIGDFFKLYYNGIYSKDFLLKRIKGKGGVSSYLNSNNVKKIMEDIEQGDMQAKKVIDAMCYQISKEIGALSTVNCGKIDKILLTGGMAYSKYIVNEIKKRVEFIGEVIVIPGEYEMASLYEGAKRVLNNLELPKEYI
ncbi:MAG: butyrate kinase [Cetobacterium sp.]